MVNDLSITLMRSDCAVTLCCHGTSQQQKKIYYSAISITSLRNKILNFQAFVKQFAACSLITSQFSHVNIVDILLHTAS